MYCMRSKQSWVGGLEQSLAFLQSRLLLLWKLVQVFFWNGFVCLLFPSKFRCCNTSNHFHCSFLRCIFRALYINEQIKSIISCVASRRGGRANSSRTQPRCCDHCVQLVPPGTVTAFLFAPFLRLRAGRSRLLTHPAKLPDLRSFKKNPVSLISWLGWKNGLWGACVCTGGSPGMSSFLEHLSGHCFGPGLATDTWGFVLD